MPAKYEVTPISNATLAHSFTDTKVCLAKHPSTRKYHIGVWFTECDKLYLMNVPSAPVTSPVNLSIHKKIMLNANQYFFIEGKYKGPESVPYIIVKEHVLTNPAPITPQVLEVLGFQLKNVEPTPEPASVAQEEEKKEEKQCEPIPEPQPAAQEEEKKSEDFGHVVLGSVISSQPNNGRSSNGPKFIHEIRYNCPYKNDVDYIKATCMFTRKPGEQYTTGSYISFRDMPKLQLFISDGGNKIQLLTTEIDALCCTIHMSLIQPEQENSDDMVPSGIWFATDATINAKGEITMNMKHTETRDIRIMRARKTFMNKDKIGAQNWTPTFLSYLLQTPFDFSKFVDGKLDATVQARTGNYAIRLYMNDEAFNNDPLYTRLV